MSAACIDEERQISASDPPRGEHATRVGESVRGDSGRSMRKLLMAGQLHSMLDLLWGYASLLTRSCTPQGPSGLAGPHCWSGRLLWSVRLLGTS